MGDDGVEAVMEAREIDGFDGCGVAVDVILKVLAEQAGAIPWQAAGARLQEEARAFDAAEAKDVALCVEYRLHAGKSAAAETGGGIPFGQEFDGAGVEPEVDIGVRVEGSVVETGEVRFRAPA